MKISKINKIHSETPIQMYDVVECNPYHNFLIKAKDSYIVSHNCNFSDEVNFSAMTNNVEAMKKKQLQLISQVDARMKSRFLRGDYLPTVNIIASSKNQEQSFLDSYINTKKKNESKNTLIVDEPQWVVDSRKVTGKWFYVAIGNKFSTNELLPLNPPESLLEEHRASGRTLIKVPMPYYENFQDNLDGALTDIAGIATASSTKYISGIRWNEIKNSTYQNPFTSDVLEIGNASDDLVQYSEYFDLKRVSSLIKRKPMFIHLDLSLTGDKTGIAGVSIIGKKPTIEGEDSSRELFYQVAFSVSIKAPKGHQVAFDKTRNFIRWLRAQGFSIKGISADTFQSAQISQQLIADGFEVKSITVDRLDHDTKMCLPYAYFKSTIYDHRLVVYEDCKLLTEEVVGLERESDGHINHPENGKYGSKDQVDAVCGALWNASQHAEEYSYEYGDDYNVAISVNDNTTYMDDREEDKQFAERMMQMELNRFLQRAGIRVEQEPDEFVIM